MIRLLPVVLVALAAPASAQSLVAGRVLEGAPWCNDVHHASDLEVVCEVRETILYADRLDVESVVNGPVHVKEWDRADVLVRARIAAVAATTPRAAALVDASSVDTDQGTVQSRLPPTRRREHVSVSYEIFAPRDTDLEVATVNGPVSIHGLRGQIRADAVNGPISLEGVGGDVRVRAVNGPVTVALEGDRWQGGGLEVRTENGPITVTVPDGYSAQVVAETRMGRVTMDDLEVCDAEHRRGRHYGDTLRGRLGHGGQTISLTTANGPVRLVPRG